MFDFWVLMDDINESSKWEDFTPPNGRKVTWRCQGKNAKNLREDTRYAYMVYIAIACIVKTII